MERPVISYCTSETVDLGINMKIQVLQIGSARDMVVKDLGYVSFASKSKSAVITVTDHRKKIKDSKDETRKEIAENHGNQQIDLMNGSSNIH